MTVTEHLWMTVFKIHFLPCSVSIPTSNHPRRPGKKVFLNISQISQETPVSESLFNKVAGLTRLVLMLQAFIKKRLQYSCFPEKCARKFGSLPTNCLSVFDHFVGLAFKGLNITIVIKTYLQPDGKLFSSLTFLSFQTLVPNIPFSVFICIFICLFVYCYVKYNVKKIIVKIEYKKC